MCCLVKGMGCKVVMQPLHNFLYHMQLDKALVGYCDYCEHSCRRLSHQPVTATRGISSRAASVYVGVERDVVAWNNLLFAISQHFPDWLYADGCYTADLEACRSRHLP